MYRSFCDFFPSRLFSLVFPYVRVNAHAHSSSLSFFSFFDVFFVRSDDIRWQKTVRVCACSALQDMRRRQTYIEREGEMGSLPLSVCARFLCVFF